MLDDQLMPNLLLFLNDEMNNLSYYNAFRYFVYILYRSFRLTKPLGILYILYSSFRYVAQILKA